MLKEATTTTTTAKINTSKKKDEEKKLESKEEGGRTVIQHFLATDPLDYLGPDQETNNKLMSHLNNIWAILKREEKIFSITGTRLTQTKLLGRFQDLEKNFNSREMLAKFHLNGNPSFQSGRNIDEKENITGEALVWWKEYVESDGIVIRRNIVIDSDCGQIFILNDIDPAHPALGVNEENLRKLHTKLGYYSNYDYRFRKKTNQELKVFLKTFILDAIALLQQDLDGLLNLHQRTFQDPFGLRIGICQEEVHTLLGLPQTSHYTTQKGRNNNHYKSVNKKEHADSRNYSSNTRSNSNKENNNTRYNKNGSNYKNDYQKKKKFGTINPQKENHKLSSSKYGGYQGKKNSKKDQGLAKIDSNYAGTHKKKRDSKGSGTKLNNVAENSQNLLIPKNISVPKRSDIAPGKFDKVKESLNHHKKAKKPSFANLKKSKAKMSLSETDGGSSFGNVYEDLLENRLIAPSTEKKGKNKGKRKSRNFSSRTLSKENSNQKNIKENDNNVDQKEEKTKIKSSPDLGEERIKTPDLGEENEKKLEKIEKISASSKSFPSLKKKESQKKVVKKKEKRKEIKSSTDLGEEKIERKKTPDLGEENEKKLAKIEKKYSSCLPRKESETKVVKKKEIKSISELGEERIKTPDLGQENEKKLEKIEKKSSSKSSFPSLKRKESQKKVVKKKAKRRSSRKTSPEDVDKKYFAKKKRNRIAKHSRNSVNTKK